MDLESLRLHQPETLAFQEAAAESRFVLPFCRACGRAHWYPRAVCPLCGGGEIEWRAASGHGTIYSVSVMRRASPPYALAWVTLAEGPTMLTNLVDCDIDAARIGDPVQVVLQRQEDGAFAPMFTLA